jgi:glycosyltransferase involved in cell wall biosynthesis
MPRLVVAMPVYNGASLLGEAIEDLRAQTHSDFEILIFDNCSQDATFEIAARAAEADKRIRVVRRDATIPAIENFGSAMDASDCDYFCWRAYDDLSAPNYLEILAKTLTENPTLSLAAGAVHTLKPHKSRSAHVRQVPNLSDHRIVRALQLMRAAPAAWIYGLFRKHALQREFERAAAALPQGWATDHLTMFPMLINGRVGVTGDTHFVQRIIKDPAKTNWVQASISAKLQTRQAFKRYCYARIQDSELSTTEKAIVRAAVPSYAGARTYSLGKIIAGTVKR